VPFYWEQEDCFTFRSISDPGNRMYICYVVGEKITDKGIGNGISLLIMVGIIATLPQHSCLIPLRLEGAGNGGFMMILIELVIWFLIILAICLPSNGGA
jgi:preprotein translocase subunit SecY